MPHQPNFQAHSRHFTIKTKATHPLATSLPNSGGPQSSPTLLTSKARVRNSTKLESQSVHSPELLSWLPLQQGHQGGLWLCLEEQPGDYFSVNNQGSTLKHVVSWCLYIYKLTVKLLQPGQQSALGDNISIGLKNGRLLIFLQIESSFTKFTSSGIRLIANGGR